MTKEELTKLREKLPSGYRKTLAEEFNVTTTHIGYVLRGDRNNFRIVESAVALAKNHQQKLKKQSSIINKL
jgi:hypothetical protein